MVKAKNAIFVHSALDDAGLTPSEFRVVAHIARREGKFPCFEAVPNMAKKCNLHETTVRDCLKTLVEREILLTRKRPGRPSLYRVNHPKILHPSQSDGVHPSQSDGDKGNPINVSPLRKSARINTQDNSDSQRSHEMRSDLGRHPPPGTPWENRPPAEIPTEAEVVEFGRGPAAVPEFYCERYHEKNQLPEHGLTDTGASSTGAAS